MTQHLLSITMHMLYVTINNHMQTKKKKKQKTKTKTKNKKSKTIIYYK